MKRQHGSLLVYGLVALAILAVLAGIGRSIYSAGFDAAKLECEEAAREQREAEATQANAASTKLEAGNEEAKIVYRTITKTVDTYIDRPVYRSVCFDADGLRDANAALSGARTPAGKPDAPLPASRTALRWEWGLRAAQDDRGG